MPRIFDNIDQPLLQALQQTLESSTHADFCVGYFNLRGWRRLANYIENWQGGDDECCRLLIGMQRLPDEELRHALRIFKNSDRIDNQTALHLKKKLAAEFREQLTVGIPTREDEIGLRQLARQLRAEKVKVKLYLRHPLHAKLYLLHRQDLISPIVGYLGSSNLTLAGLSQQGELNIDVLDADACQKLETWFEDRWTDRWCIDISKELVEIIDESWAREELIPPYHIYIKMAYHLSHEARAGLNEFQIPREFENTLFDFQTAAVKIAAHHLNKRGGVLIGDVVGLGKTLMGTALARIMEDDHDLETLIICPKNLVQMWEYYREEYRLRGKVLSMSRVLNELPDLRRYRLVMIDESHNLRNREGKRYRAIQDYIQQNESQVILLSATPYNKTFLDLSNQLRLFVDESEDIGIRPDHYINKIGGELMFMTKHQSGIRTLAAFEQSEEIDDWRELMRRYLVRRTRSFIMQNYAEEDTETKRKYLLFPDGTRSYFPTRAPKTVKFTIDEKNPDDTYAQLYSNNVVDIINSLNLARYGLANYIDDAPAELPTEAEKERLQDLSRGGKRLMGFCRTNLFKRLESSGKAFLQSVDRHILRNYIFLYAIENSEPFPIGGLDASMLDTRFNDADTDDVNLISAASDDEDDELIDTTDSHSNLWTIEKYKERAAIIYQFYLTEYSTRFKWIRSDLFLPILKDQLTEDAEALIQILQLYGEWDETKDAKLNALEHLLTQTYPGTKVLVFTQFADTVHYLKAALEERGLTHLAAATGDAANPTQLATRFSPVSNNREGAIRAEDELRVLISTDVLSEGQNLQDCAIVVNYDLPWAIIRLVQRAGRVDRIGQTAEEILCYSFLPAEGVERLINLRGRVRARLQENAEVVGTDEAFFEDDGERGDQAIVDLYNEHAGLLDDDMDNDVDLASHAYQIWKNAITDDPDLEKIITKLPSVVYSTKPHSPTDTQPEGALVYIRTGDDNDALAWVDKNGESVTESQFTILQAAACKPETEALQPLEKHHHLVHEAAKLIVSEDRRIGGQLGRSTGARFRTYQRLKDHASEVEDTLFATADLKQVIENIYRYPLRPVATDILNRQLRLGISNEKLTEVTIELWNDGRLCIVEDEIEMQEPKIVCSLGLST
ncbi:NgoFVII family restriction endonuclease [Candidatus Poribacteria bacterium]|nr:MAG: NgoFVII family restriction endonuclease [Candidatus Poribacteria bacterium]